MDVRSPNSSTLIQDEGETGTPPFVIFDILQLLALLFLCLTLIPAAVSQSVSRMRSWYALMSGRPPSLGFCLFQACLTFAAPPLVALAALIFITELYLRLSSVALQRAFPEHAVFYMFFTLPAIYVFIFWEAMFMGLERIPTVERREGGMFCHVDQTRLSLVTGICVIVLLAIMSLIEVYTLILLLRRIGKVTMVKLLADGVPSLAFPLHMFVRVALYTVIGGMGIIFSDILLNANVKDGGTVYLFAMIPLSVALLFFSQKDILRFYMFWKKPAPYTEV
ncbi:hypothetical protein BDZ89DRAFT_1160918 [Hymenopellis radicata]|nr:hypothetical protein BDZ89DRAFT_1160918 [Hymenopellis radicata]